MTNKSKIEVTYKPLGGYRTLKKLKLSTQRLLKALWEKHGGVRAMARKTGQSAQSHINWRNTGKVSLKYAGDIARIIDVPLEVLNYEDIGRLRGKNSDWVTLVKGCKFEPYTEKWILAATPPMAFGKE